MLSLAPSARFAVLLAALALTLGVAAPAAHAFAGRDGMIVFSWGGYTESELGPPFTVHHESAIQTVGLNGGRPATLRGCTQDTGKPDVGDCSIGYGSPAVSPDGMRVAFATGRSLALMDIDGGALRLLPAHSPSDGEPAFSPTGTRLAFSAGPSPSARSSVPRGVWTSDLFGTRARRLTAHGTAPAWSARNWIAFLRADGVFRVRPDGRGLRRLVARSRCTSVAFSPHGTKLAFTCRERLFIANADGSRVRQVPGIAYVSDVAWSPSGGRLLVDISEGGQLLTIRTDGSHARQVAAGGVGAVYNYAVGSADWQPLR